MALYDRLIGISEPKIAVHQFAAACRELARGQMTAQEVATSFGLDAGEQIEAATLFSAVQGPGLTGDEVEQVLELAEAGIKFTTAAAVKTRFGV